MHTALTALSILTNKLQHFDSSTQFYLLNSEKKKKKKKILPAELL